MSIQPAMGAAGWLQDPSGRFDYRYWDGSRWTAAVMRGGATYSDPEAPPETPAPSPAMAPAVPSADAAPPPSGHDRLTPLPPSEAQERLSFQMAAVGFHPTGVSQGRIDAVLAIKKEPNVVIFLLLLLIWIIPGIVYYMLASGTKLHRASIYFAPNGSGTRVAVRGDPGALQALAPLLAQLPW